MPNVTTLSLPCNGRIPIWTGTTMSGQLNSSILSLPNRTIQVHFRSLDNVDPFSEEINDPTFQQLATYLYEFTMRHYGFMCDELQSANFILPNLNDDGALFGQANRNDDRTNHLRFTDSETIGREICVGCPEIGNKLALRNLQATEIIYTHFLSPPLDVLIVKIIVSNASNRFIQDFQNNFPSFNFNTPMNYRNQFRMNERNHIFRY